MGLDWSYDAIEVTADELPAFLDGLDGTWAGLSLTMPLKQAVLPLLKSSSDLVQQVAAANTVLLPARRGENTDVFGIVAALREGGVRRVSSAVVLGGGATARSALAALAALGCRSPTLVVRSAPDETLAAAARLGVTPTVADWDPGVLAGCEVVVSTVPPGAADRFAPYVADVPVLLDVVYDPWPTPLAAGCRGSVVGGATMLLHQAAAQVALMTGREVPVAAMRSALVRVAGAAGTPQRPRC
ncbi:MAG: shikimate dehydrogenase [Actinomycetota bacterium]|jgi:shikimate dehydrogenase|nr:shikimate dehydrogenase [Actinomycetota bacterium]